SVFRLCAVRSARSRRSFPTRRSSDLYPPFEDFDDSAPSGFSGFDIDIVQAIADGLDLELAVKDSSFDGLQSGLSLNAGECDMARSEDHTSELQSRENLVCRLLLEKKN